MIDNVNPNTQFHPYQPPTAEPHSETRSTAVDRMLRKAGLDQNRIDSLNRSLNDLGVERKIEDARNWARNHSGMVLGGLAALVIGAGMMRKRPHL
jgi:hypothetical protein